MGWQLTAGGRDSGSTGHRRESERSALVGLLVVVVAVLVSSLLFGASKVPLTLLLLPIMVSSLTLSVRGVGLVMVGVTAVAAAEISDLGFTTARVIALITIAIGGLLAAWVAAARQRVGGLGLRGEAMLLELRDALRAQGRLPTLPVEWRHEVSLESAGGASFGGDFVVSSLSPDGGTLEVAVVDVSGKGIDAGTRALLCTGAFSALLGAVPPGDFLPAANAYLLRQAWDEGFATAVHLVLDLKTGDYTLESAGHPPAVQFLAGTGRWHVAEVEGTALGLVASVSYDVVRGRLGVGDALMLYTDGVVELPGRDLSLGIDKLVGEAERLIGGGFTGGVQRLLTAMRSGASDDRALLLLWRH